jgi:hypothetical protein
VFVVIGVEASRLPQLATILSAAYVTLGPSVLLRGVSAARLADRYARWLHVHPEDRGPAVQSVPATPQRIRGRALFSPTA